MRHNLKTILHSKGYTLMELVFTLAVIMIGLGSLYGVTQRGLNQIKIVGSKDYALIAAASELEYIKAISRERFPENYAGPFISAGNLSALNEANGFLEIRDFEKADSRLKEVTATVRWSVAGRMRSVSLSTLVGAP